MTDDIELPEITVSVTLGEIRELKRLASRIISPDVTYDEDKLCMAEQAIRLNKTAANIMFEILLKWEGSL